MQYNYKMVLCCWLQRKEWLSKALDGMMGDPLKNMMDNIMRVGKFLGNEAPTEEMKDDALASLENLCDWCENLDLANGKGLSIFY